MNQKSTIWGKTCWKQENEGAVIFCIFKQHKKQSRKRKVCWTSLEFCHNHAFIVTEPLLLFLINNTWLWGREYDIVHIAHSYKGHRDNGTSAVPPFAGQLAQAKWSRSHEGRGNIYWRICAGEGSVQLVQLTFDESDTATHWQYCHGLLPVCFDIKNYFNNFQHYYQHDNSSRAVQK